MCRQRLAEMVVVAVEAGIEDSDLDALASDAGTQPAVEPEACQVPLPSLDRRYRWSRQNRRTLASQGGCARKEQPTTGVNNRAGMAADDSEERDKVWSGMWGVTRQLAGRNLLRVTISAVGTVITELRCRKDAAGGEAHSRCR
jgi:hypothetical protein